MSPHEDVSLSSMEAPSSTLLVGESELPRTLPEFYVNGPDLRFRNHLQTSNWLFADGHVKSLRPAATITPVNLWNSKNTPRAAPEAAQWVTWMNDAQAAMQ